MARSASRSTTPDELREPLARRFLSDARHAVWAHPVLALLLAIFLRDALGPGRAFTLAALIVAGTALRLLLHRRARSVGWDDPGAPLAWTRASTATLAASWGGVAFLVIPAVSPAAAARFLVLGAGLIGGALATHQADRRGFHLFAALLLLPTLAAFAVAGSDFLALDALLILVFWGVVALLHRQTHQELRQGIRSNLQLQESIGVATREQDFVSAVLTGVPHALAVLDPDGQLARSSLAFQDLVDMDGETLAGIPPERRSGDPFWSHLDRIAGRARGAGRAEEEVTVRGSCASHDDGTCHLRISAAAAGGAATGWIVLLVEDLTPIRRAEAARRQAEAEYEDLVQSAHDLIWKTDLEGNWSYLNAAAGEIYGESPVDLLGTSALDRATPENLEADRAAFASVVAGGELVNHETVHRTGRNGTRVLSFSARPILDDDDSIVGVQGVARDVTEWKAAEEQVRRMADEAAEATRMKSAFLANMSHEIRTPMNGVLGMTELLLDTELDEEQRQFLEIIQGSGENLLRLLNDILDFSKIEAGRLELEDIDFPLARTLEDAVAVLKPVALGKGNQLEMEVDPALPAAVRGDPGRLSQVLTNLVSNAIKFTQSGTVTVRARRVTGGARDQHLQVEVEDTGVGIAADKLDNIFAEFAQADTSVTRKYGGTGLGLAICRRLVELMGGEIGAESREGRGSTFHFRIPLRATELPAPCESGTLLKGEEPASPAGEAAPSPPAGPAPPSANGGSPAAPPPATHAPVSPAPGQPRILLAEDTPVNRQVATAVLRRAGFHVTEVENGADAVTAVEGGGLDLVLMDIQMPVMDGLDATRAIRELQRAGRAPSLPIVALTAHALPEERSRCLDAGMDDFLSKPFKPQRLISIIRRWLPDDLADGEPERGPADAGPPPVAAGSGSAGAPHPDPQNGDRPGSHATDPPAVLLDEFRAAMAEAGIAEVADTMLDLFEDELPDHLAALRRAGAEGDLAALASAAHALKSSAGNIRADDLLARMKSLESVARTGDLPTARRGLEEALEEIDRVRTYLEAAR